MATTLSGYDGSYFDVSGGWSNIEVGTKVHVRSEMYSETDAQSTFSISNDMDEEDTTANITEPGTIMRIGGLSDDSIGTDFVVSYRGIYSFSGDDGSDVKVSVYFISDGDRTYSFYSPSSQMDPDIEYTIEDITVIPCLVRGTLIETPSGAVAVEDLRVDDLVVTKDHGPQPIRWIGSKAVDGLSRPAKAAVRPIRIRAGALGPNTPTQDLLVSPQHRILVRSTIVERMFNTAEVLVAAKQLLQVDGIDVADDLAEVEYFHLFFDQHEVIVANGAETESLYPGRQAIRALPTAAVEELFTFFPELRDMDHTPVAARLLPSGRQARKMAVRHVDNGKPLVVA